MSHNTDAARNNFNRTAWFYEPLAAIYSFGKIKASKLHELNYIQSGDKVLYAGVGGGEDSVAAAAHGAQVTCVDLAPAMLARARAKLESRGLSAELICGDIMQHDRVGHYDVVCANYFLNVFSKDLMEKVLTHLVTLLRPGGKFLIADFAVPRGNPVLRGLHILYYRIANVLYWTISRNGLHPIYDYEAFVGDFGLQYRETTRHSLFPGGPEYYHTVVAAKPVDQPGA